MGERATSSPQIEPNYELREALVARIGHGVLVESDGITLRNVHADNQHFPHFLYGCNVETGERVALQLVDDQLPTIIEDNGQPPTRPSTSKRPRSSFSSGLRALAELTGNPVVGILTKIGTDEGMSSQLIIRYDAIARGEISELLPGEKEYEEARHELSVFYQTQNFCDLPEASRDQALSDMQALGNIADEEERQAAASNHPIFGRRDDL